MKIFIYSRHREISQIIADHLSYKGNHCIPFFTLSDLSSMMKNLQVGPDLLILDYLTFNHDIFNVYTYFKSLNKSIPVIFYNDPCLTRSTRALHWKAILELTLSDYDKKDYSIYDEVFIELAELIESNEFLPYVSLLQPPKEIPQSLIKERLTLQYMKDMSDDCITSFKQRNNLPNNLFYLLSLLQKNKDSSLSIDRILEYYKMDGKQMTEKSLKVLISNLKKKIRSDKECAFLIYHEDGKYRFVRYKY